MPKKNSLAENIKLGLRVKAARERAGLTQSELAELIDIAPNNLSAVECGRSSMSIPTLCKFCAVLDISSDSILFDQTPKNDVSHLAQKLSALEPEQFAVVENIVNQLLPFFNAPKE